MRVLRWILYVAIFIVTATLSFADRGLWPPGGPDTKEARELAKALLAVIVVVGTVTVVFLTVPRVSP